MYFLPIKTIPFLFFFPQYRITLRYVQHTSLEYPVNPNLYFLPIKTLIIIFLNIAYHLKNNGLGDSIYIKRLLNTKQRRIGFSFSLHNRGSNSLCGLERAGQTGRQRCSSPKPIGRGKDVSHPVWLFVYLSIFCVRLLFILFLPAVLSISWYCGSSDSSY